MAYDERVAARVRRALAERAPAAETAEKKMFGGLAFLLRGHMACGVLGSELMVRVGPDAHDASLARPHARPMDFTGKPLRGFVYVAPDGFASARDLARWVGAGADFVQSLPPKIRSAPDATARGSRRSPRRPAASASASTPRRRNRRRA